MDSSTTTPKKIQRKRTQQYSMCFLYNAGESLAKLTGLSVATCNPTSERSRPSSAVEKKVEQEVQQRPDYTTVSEKMSCNYCTTDFETRDDQTSHYKSDWHRYNLRQRLKGAYSVSEEKFEELSGDVSSISGSDSDSDDEVVCHVTSKPIGIATRFQRKTELMGSRSSTDSESDDASNMGDEKARKFPKIFLKNSLGELISIYRCVVYHKQIQPATHSDLISMVTDVPRKMKWAVLMSSGGHFAGAIFDREKVVVHKTFHRYIVRAKRGTAQSSRDNQGNAPKSAGAALRRHNEAALKEDVRELLTSWDEHLKSCDLIFLRAPSFNKKIFFSGKAPPLDKRDRRIRMIPFQTKRPTLNEARRVHQMLASIECYGDESDIQDFVPLSPQVSFSADDNQLVIVPNEPKSPRRKVSRDRQSSSPMSTEFSGDSKNIATERVSSPKQRLTDKLSSSPLTKDTIDRLIQSENISSSGNSTASDTEVELVQSLQTLRMDHLKEFEATKKPKRKKNTRKRRPSIKHQQEPGINPLDEEKYHLKNSLYTACKTGDAESLINLLAVFSVPDNEPDEGQGQNNEGQGQPSSCNLHTSNGKKTSAPDFLKPCGSDVQFEIEIDEESLDNNSNVDPKQLFSEFQTVASDSTKVHDSVEKDDKTMQDDLQDMVINGQASSTVGENNTESMDGSGPQDAIDTLEKSNLSLNMRSSQPSSREGSRSRHSSGNVAKEAFSPIIVTSDLLNETIGDSGMTLLMIAAKEGHKKLVPLLLTAGSNPALRDKYGQTAYQMTKEKETRNEFRRFMAKFPDKYDYDTAKIPGPLTEEMEAERRKKDAERKKLQKKAKQERDKEKKAEEAKIKAEEREKTRFLNLSDREKRALAAEKRLQQQNISDGHTVVLSRCFQCAKDMTGKVPFEYSDYKFCSPKCLKEHRMKSTKS